MRDLQLEIPARFPTHYPFRARELLNRRVTLQLSAGFSSEQGKIEEIFQPMEDTKNTKGIDRTRFHLSFTFSKTRNALDEEDKSGSQEPTKENRNGPDSWIPGFQIHLEIALMRVYETCTILSSLLKNSPNSSEKRNKFRLRN
jgi:hypothetical protein